MTRLTRRARIGLVGLAAVGGALAVALTAAPARAAAPGPPVLVVAAHPDDETLGFAGVIESALAAGRPVYVAVVTNGAAVTNPNSPPVCGAADGTPAGFASVALRRDAESVAAMSVLGGPSLPSLPWTQDIATSHVFFLGYPDGGLQTIAGGGSFVDPSGLGHTYAGQGDPTKALCNGDYHYLRTGSHAALTAADLSGDLAALIAQIEPTDVYTHGMQEGHPDHATVGRLVLKAVVASGLTVDVHGTLIHETGNALCQGSSASWWPNPESTSNPVDRSTPGQLFGPPAVFATSAGLPNGGYATCPDGGSPIAHDWGPLGAPTDEVAVPADMRVADLTQNKKWLTIEQYASQLGCDVNPASASCGYLHGFVKSDEIFWSQQVSGSGTPVPLDWPRLSGPQSGNTVTLSVEWPLGELPSFLGATSVRYQWLRCVPATPWDAADQCATIGGATLMSYVVQAADAGFVVRVRATGLNAAGDAPAVYSGTTSAVTAPGNTALPFATGTPAVGQTLIAQPGTWTGWPAPTYDYVWTSSADGATWSSPGVHAREYTVAAGDRYVRVRVTATNAAGSAPAVLSPVLTVGLVPANTAPPAISGSATVGSTLTAGTGIWTENPTSYAYDWRRCDATGASCASIGATGSTYVAAAADLGATLRVAVTAANASGSAPAPAISAATAPVQAAASGGGGSTGGGSSGGGGGGGGGGGSSYPDLHVVVTADQTVAPAVGRPVTFHVTVSSKPVTGLASQVYADVTLPTGFVVTQTISDRGSGCTAAAPGLVCSLDWIAPGIDGHITILGTVGTAGAQTISAHARHWLLEADPSDDTGTLTLSPPAPAETPPSTPAGAASPHIGLVKAVAAKTGAVTVRVAINGWSVNAKQLKSASGASGYWLIWVDGKRNAISRLPAQGVTKALAPGRHRIQVELVRENGRFASPRALSTVVTVTVPLRPWIGLTKTVRAKNGRVTVQAKIMGWTINRHAVATAKVGATSRVSGYWIVTVDGKRAAVSRLAGTAVLRQLAPGPHTIRLELLREDGSRIAPRARSAPVRITIAKRTAAGRASGKA